MTRARSLSKLSNPATFTVDTDNNVGVNSTSPKEKLNVVGVISATSFFGDGTGLTGVASTDNIITGTAATFNNVVKVGTAITLDATSGIITATRVNADSLIVSGISTLGGGITVPNNQPVTIGDITIENRTSPATGSLIETSDDLLIKSGRLLINNADNDENMIIATQNAAVELFHNNSKKLETTSGGVTVTGTLAATAVTGDGSELTNLPASGDSNDITASLFI